MDIILCNSSLPSPRCYAWWQRCSGSNWPHEKPMWRNAVSFFSSFYVSKAVSKHHGLFTIIFIIINVVIIIIIIIIILYLTLLQKLHSDLPWNGAIEAASFSRSNKVRKLSLMFDRMYLAWQMVSGGSDREQRGIQSWISSASASVGFEKPATVRKPLAL